MLKKILVPTDASPESERALPLAERLARLHGAEVHLVQIVQYPVIADEYQMSTGETWQQMLDMLVEAAEGNLNAVSGRFTAAGIKVSPQLVYGSPAAVLLDLE